MQFVALWKLPCIISVKIKGKVCKVSTRILYFTYLILFPDPSRSWRANLFLLSACRSIWTWASIFFHLVSNITPLFSFQSQTGLLRSCPTSTTCLLGKNEPNHRTASLFLTLLLTLFKGLYEQAEVGGFTAFALRLKSQSHQGRDWMYLFLSEHNSFHTNSHGMGRGKGVATSNDLTTGLMECEIQIMPSLTSVLTF